MNLKPTNISNSRSLSYKTLSLGILLLGMTLIIVTLIFKYFFLSLFSTLFLIIGLWLIRKLVKKSLVLSPAFIDDPVIQRLKDVRHGASQVKYYQHLSSYGETTFSQIEEIQTRYQFLKKILSIKFNPGEITHDRYVGAVDEVVTNLLANLQLTISILTSLKGIKLEKLSLERKNEYDLSIEKVLLNLEANNKMLNELDILGRSLSEINALKISGPEFEDLLDKLKTLSQQAHRYSTNKE